MGINLSSVNYYSSQLPFVDEFKSSQSWVTQTQGVWNTREEDLLALDSNGWVESLPTSTAEAQYDRVGTLLFRDHASYLPGNYLVLYEGEGTIEYRLDAEKNETLSISGRDVIEVNPSTSGILLTIRETDPNQTGDYIRNIRVIPEAEEFATTSFNPRFIEKIEPFSTLRLMDWMETNNSEQKEWLDRPKIEDARYSEIGVPVEIMVELANQTDTNPWFTIPHQATDDYIANFARYVKDNLESDLEVYVEYSNEVWNGFEQNQYAREQALATFSDPDLNFLDWYSKRTTETIQIWEEVFTQDSARVIGVAGAQAANPWIGERILDYSWSDVTLSNLDTGIDALAIAPYFGRYIGLPENKNQLESWTQEADGGLNKLFQEITQGGLLNNSPEGGALADAYRNIKDYVEIARQANLPLITYEGGQHLVGTEGLENNQAITDLFIAANRDSRMGTVYQDYLEQWSNLGGDLFVHFSDIRSHNKWGSWGALESISQESSPKYDALVDFVRDREQNQDDVRSGAESAGQEEPDIFVFESSPASGSYKTMVNFVSGEDQIDVSGLNIAFWKTLQPLINNNSHNNAVIEFTLQSSSFKIEIENTQSDRLTAQDFIFSQNSKKDEVAGSHSRDDLFGGRGNDTLRGLADSDRLFGETGQDLLEGGDGDDILDGGNGKDILIGGIGNDTLTGGRARDLFTFQTDTAFNSSTMGIDTIVDFSVGRDKIHLSQNTFIAVKSDSDSQLLNQDFAVVTDDADVTNNHATIVYNQNNGNLFYRSEESDSGALFAVIQNTPDNVSASDFVIFDV